MLKTFEIVDGKITESPNGAILSYISPTEEEKRYLVDTCQIDPHSLNSALDPDEISRVEFEDNHIAIILKQPRNYSAEDLLGFGVTSVGIFLFDDKMIIVQPEENPLFEYGRGALRARSLRGVILRILHHATNHFLEHLKIIRLISARIEKDIEFSVSNHHLTEMFVLSKSLTYYESATTANKVLLAKLVRDTEKIGFSAYETARGHKNHFSALKRHCRAWRHERIYNDDAGRLVGAHIQRNDASSRAFGIRHVLFLEKGKPFKI